MASIPRRLCRSLLSNPTNKAPSHLSMRFFSSSFSSHEISDSDDSIIEPPDPNLESEPHPHTSPSPSSSSDSSQHRSFFERPLENGLDPGIYKAILVGQVGQSPMQKRLKSGRTVTLLSVGTGGIRNNRRPLDNEEPREYANRCAVQWHRVAVYPEKLGAIAMKHVVTGPHTGSSCSSSFRRGYILDAAIVAHLIYFSRIRFCIWRETWRPKSSLIKSLVLYDV